MGQIFQAFFSGSNPDVPIFFVTDFGIATAAANTINVLGGSNVSTAGSGNTITIDVSGGSSFTPGSVIFASSTGAFTQDNANFFWDETNHRLSLGGSIVPTNTLTVHGSSYFDGDISQIGSTVALAASTIQFSSFTTGIAHFGPTGILTSSAVNLAGADVTGILSPTNGGTGVANASGSTITLGGAIVTQGKFNLSGAFDATFTLTNTTSVTFPTSGTLATTAGTVASVTGTANRIIIGGTSTNPTVDIAATYVGQSSITTLGTVTTGIWNASTIPADRGGTGVVNASSSTITLGGALTTIGAFTSSFTMTGNTAVTFPTSGTLATTGGTVSSITGTASQVLVNGTTGSPQSGALTLTTPQNIATNSSPSFFSVICSGGSSNAFQAFTSSGSTSPLTTLASLLMRNSNATANNWMTITFLDNSGSVSALIGAQCISANVNTDLVFYASSTSGGGAVAEGMRLIGATNKLSLVNPLAVSSGGTNIASYAVGDLLYASGTTTLSKLADVATGNALISGGVTTAPSWGKIGLTTHVSGTLGVGNGGTGTATAFDAGSIVFAGGSGVYTQDNTANNQFFYDNTNHRLAIGNTAPITRIHITTQGSSGATLDSYATNSSLSFRRADGTIASPTKILIDELIGGIFGFGYEAATPGFSPSSNASIQIRAAEDFNGTTNKGTYITLNATPTASGTSAEVIRVLGTGFLRFSNAASFSANGAVATVLTAIGPTGSRTTVQKWLTIQDAAGNPFYIPCF